MNSHADATLPRSGIPAFAEKFDFGKFGHGGVFERDQPIGQD